MLKIRKIAIAILLFLPLATAADEPTIKVYFSPHGGVSTAIINEISNAKASIEIQAYEFSSTSIASALVDAKNRGVAVFVILDRKNSTAIFSKGSYLQKQDIPVRADGVHAIMHDKTIIIDDYVVITGSYNFTDSAENANSENVVIIHDQSTAKKYLDNWKIHRDHSSPLPQPKPKR